MRLCTETELEAFFGKEKWEQFAKLAKRGLNMKKMAGIVGRESIAWFCYNVYIRERTK